MGRKNALGDYYCISSSCDKILKFSGGQFIEQESLWTSLLFVICELVLTI